MYSFLITNASKLIYGSLIAIALYSCCSAYDNYQDMKQQIVIQQETITEQTIKLKESAKAANDNAKAYKKAKADEVYLLLQIHTLSTTITEITNQHKQELSSIEEEIDNAPEQIKQCLRSDIPANIVNSLRKPTEASNPVR